MKTNELMIGDWVMLTDPINNGEKVQVKEIHGDGYITVDGAITKMFEPIPLTAEILEKNGFNETFWGGEWTNNKVDFILIEHSDGFRVIDTNIVLSGVHQLQHALRLCGINKEIIL